MLMKAEHRVLRRRLAGIRCKDIMSRDVISASPSNSMQDAWHRLNHHKVKALPVLAEDWQLAGIISLHDIFMAAGGPHDSIGTKRWSERRVGEIMNSTPVTVAPDQSIADLATVFSDGGMHHLPVVDARNRVVGMLSQSGLCRRLAGCAEMNWRCWLQPFLAGVPVTAVPWVGLRVFAISKAIAVAVLYPAECNN